MSGDQSQARVGWFPAPRLAGPPDSARARPARPAVVAIKHPTVDGRVSGAAELLPNSAFFLLSEGERGRERN